MLAPLAPEHRDVITTGGQVLIAMFVFGGSVIGYMLERLRRETTRTRRTTEQARQAAETAVVQTETTGNGYAARTEGKLDWLIDNVRDIQRDQLELRREVGHQGRRLDRHLDPQEPS